MDVHELALRLAPFGLDASEAHILFHLSRLGPARAAEVTRAAARPRGEAYRLLDSLVAKGFVEKTLERPTRFLARPLEESLRRSLERQRAQLAGLDGECDAVAALWPRPLAQAPDRQRYAIHQGPAQVDGLLARMVAGAQEEVLVATSADGLARIDGARLRAALEARADAGVEVRVLARRGRGGELPLRASRLDVRYGDLPTFYQAVLVDAREIALFVSAGRGVSGTEETVLWLNSSDVVLAQKSLFDLAWAGAHTPDDLAQQPPRHVQALRGRWARTSRLRELVRNARVSLRLEASAEEAAAWSANGILAEVEQRARSGVRVDTIVHPVGAAPACRLVAVADQATVLAVLEGASAPAEEWSLVSTHAALAARLLAPPTGPHVHVRTGDL
ncbi:MAG TPA: helix-turn-helix domain-containing protein [Candidatus Thermoplasmatota archaeon]|nr:helix-turn-helix domain-containing protein [Candidatus Thermoplasmatota archaeon]